MPPIIPLDPQGRVASAYLTWTDAAGALQTFVPDLVITEEWIGPATVTQNPVEQGPNITDNIRVELRKCRLKIFATNEPFESGQWANVIPLPTTLDLPSRTFTPGSSLLLVPEWQSNLEARVLIQTAGGLLGGAIGGNAGGAIGSLAASAIAGALLQGRQIIVPTDTNIGLQPPAAPPPVTAALFGADNEADFVQLTIALLETLKSTGQTIDVFGTKTSLVGAVPGIGGMAIEELTHVRAEDDGTGATITIGLTELRIVSSSTVPAPKPSIPRAAAPVKKGNQQTGELSGAAQAAADNFVKGFQQGSADTQALLFSPHP